MTADFAFYCLQASLKNLTTKRTLLHFIDNSRQLLWNLCVSFEGLRSSDVIFAAVEVISGGIMVMILVLVSYSVMNECW